MQKKKPCEVCGAPDGPAIFCNDPWCSDDCRKFYQGEINEVTFGIISGKTLNKETGLFTGTLMKDSVKTRKRRDADRTRNMLPGS